MSGEEGLEQILHGSRIVSCIVFLLEIFVNLNTGYYYVGRIIEDRRMILQNYRDSSLYFDVLALVSVMHEFQDEFSGR
jgi:hypothetical protein